MIAPLEIHSSDLEKKVKELFSPQGLLAKAKNFEFRPQQQSMAVGVSRALTERSHLLVEAGTGVGKSLAYLVPAVLHAVGERRKAIISTHTINLQEQLFYKDIPLVQKLLPEPFNAVLLKGRQNYLCPLRLERAMQQANELFVSSEAQELKRLWQWSHETKDGTISDLDPAPDFKVWQLVCSEPHICTPRSCGQNPACAYQQARKKAEMANLLVINHSLFFNFLAGAEDELGEEVGFIFPNDFIIFDEAHTLENVAARHLGLDISHNATRRMLHRLYHPKTQKGLLAVKRDGEAMRLLNDVIDEVDAFFMRVEKKLNFGRSKEVRVTKPDLVEDILNVPLARLYRAVADLTRDTTDEIMKAELGDSARRIEGLRTDMASFLSQSNDDSVYWIERAQTNLQFLSSPIEVAPHLRTLLFRPNQSLIMTSATLSVGKGLGYFQNRIGGDDAETLQLDSPFDYARQMKIYIPKKMPEPAQKEPYEESLVYWIKYFVKKTHGKAFVLFTSYSAMQNVATTLEMFFTSMGLACLVQGGSMPRHRLLKKFKEDKNSVLFGTDSFWQGVDVPGEALSNVILTRLPFAVPDHPLTQAKLERILMRGGDPFREYSLPEAILKFRQGVGRLIRTQQDTGIIAILDNRILTKPYGKAFLAVLPRCPVEIVED